MSWYKPAYNTIDIYHGQSLSVNSKMSHTVGLFKEFNIENRSCKQQVRDEYTFLNIVLL